MAWRSQQYDIWRSAYGGVANISLNGSWRQRHGIVAAQQHHDVFSWQRWRDCPSAIDNVA